jgi:hypothetical protein
MADLDAVLEQLIQERKRAEGELKQLEKVISTLSRMRTRNSRVGPGTETKRKLSPAARERIAAAQRARWAKVRALSKKPS